MANVGEGSPRIVWETQRSLPGTSTWKVRAAPETRLLYMDLLSFVKRRSDREGGYKQERFQYVGEY